MNLFYERLLLIRGAVVARSSCSSLLALALHVDEARRVVHGRQDRVRHKG